MAAGLAGDGGDARHFRRSLRQRCGTDEVGARRYWVSGHWIRAAADDPPASPGRCSAHPRYLPYQRRSGHRRRLLTARRGLELGAPSDTGSGTWMPDPQAAMPHAVGRGEMLPSGETTCRASIDQYPAGRPDRQGRMTDAATYTLFPRRIPCLRAQPARRRPHDLDVRMWPARFPAVPGQRARGEAQRQRRQTTSSTSAWVTPARWPVPLPLAVQTAVARRYADLGGATTMLPTEDAAWVAKEPARRFGPDRLELHPDPASRRQPAGDPAGPAADGAAQDPRLSYRYHAQRGRVLHRRGTPTGHPGWRRNEGAPVNPRAHAPGRRAQPTPPRSSVRGRATATWPPC